MRFLHTADWHLGRIFHGRSLIEDQAHVLDQFVALVRDARPDAVLIAGDVYDRAVPPAEAVSLLDDTLSRIVLGEGVPVVMIAGNHDSPDRLGFGARLLAAHGLTIAGRIDAPQAGVSFDDAWGRVVVHPLPYAEPAAVRDALATDIAGHEAAMAALLERVRAAHPAGARSVLVAHAFVAGGAESESERPLSIGGSGAVDAALFSGFDYVALGHLHRPQRAGAEQVRYAGSLLKYSLSEAEHAKSVSLVELGAPGELKIEHIALSPRRDLRRLSGTLDEVLAAARVDAAREDYIFASLHDRGALLDPMAKLREVYPNVLGCERTVLSHSGEAAVAVGRARELDTRALFGDFFREVAGEALDTAASDALDASLQALADARREAS
ncbi:MAG: exonuclease SbcCD subunit D [Pseudazoarcus pumilus]|nr:exonuclease SbcCD subunit D [Pseudazoarcus pumilus]